MEMEKGDKKMRDEKMGDCPRNSDAQAQKSHSPGSRHSEGGVQNWGGGGGEQDRYFSAQGKALLLQTAVLQHASSEGNKRNKKVSLGEQELQSWQLPRVNAVHACTTASSD